MSRIGAVAAALMAQGGTPPPAGGSFNLYKITITTNNGDVYVGLNELYLYNLASADIAVKTANSGTVTNSSNFGGYPASRALRMIQLGQDTGWVNAGGSTGWVQWEDASTIEVTGFGYSPNPGETTRAPKDSTVQYSNDGISWTTALTISNQTGWVENEYRQWNFPSSVGAHKYWRWDITTNNGSGFTSAQNIVFGTTDGVINPDNIRNCLVRATTEFSGVYLIMHVLDRNSNYWVSSAGPPQSVLIYLGGKQEFSAIGFKCFEPNRMPQAFELLGSNDNGGSWTSVQSWTGATGWSIAEVRNFTI